MSVKSLIQHCETLFQDLDLTAVQDWKKKTGGKAIGFMPVYAPRELLHAAGCLPVGIFGGGDGIEVIRGDAYYQSYICRIPRSTIELGLLGKLDCLDGMLFPAICDVIRNLSGMWKILFPQKLVRYLDFPQTFDAVGRTFYLQELGHLKHELEKLTGREITDESLRNSIRLYNENRRAIEELYDLRAKIPHQVLTAEVYLLMRASNVLEVSEHTRLLRDYMSQVQNEARPERDHVRVIVSGVFCEQPPLGLIRALESSGCYIVDDDWVLGAHYTLQDTKIDGDPLQNLCDSYLGETVSTASRYEDSLKKGEFLIEQVKCRKAEGVIFAAPSFCDPALLERPMLQDALTAAKIPHTAFKYAENTGQIQVIKEETGTFADSIKLWGHEGGAGA